MKSIILTPDKSGYILIAIMCLACAAYGVKISIDVHFFMGLLTTLVSLFASAAFIWWRKHQGGPQLVIDDAGIHDLRYDAGFIPWADIEDGYVRSFKNKRFLCLELRDPEPYLQRLNPVKRRFARWDRLIGFPPIKITLFGLTGAEPEEIVAAIRSRTAASEP